MKRYLYNSLANNGIRPAVPEGAETVDAVGLDYAAYLQTLAPEDELVLVGGDGTLNYFINAVKGVEIKTGSIFSAAAPATTFSTTSRPGPGMRS